MSRHLGGVAFIVAVLGLASPAAARNNARVAGESSGRSRQVARRSAGAIDPRAYYLTPGVT